LKKEDEEKTAFITPYGIFCYQVTPFGLKNAGATYQRMMQNCLGSQIGRNIQVYIDDVVITTRKEESLISDLQETFDNLNRYKLKLNLTKCSFGVLAGQLLGFLVLARGIEANPEKNPSNTNNGETGKATRRTETHRTCGGIKSICRTIRRKYLPFYALMKKSDSKFEWIEEADTAFVQLKKVLSSPPVLVAPKKREPLLLYIAATHQVVSAVLIVERSEEGKAHEVQWLVYFLSEVLSPTKQRYPHYQKLAYSMFTIAQKLWQYFMVHPIIVVNEAPLSNILNNPEAI
jgi:hypothetical protein